MLPALRPDAETGVEPFTCFDCRTPGRLGFLDLEVRRAWHCGWLSRQEWTPGPAELPTRFGDIDYTLRERDENGQVSDRPVDVCPGYFKAQAAAAEADMATAALRHGELGRFFPGDENVVMEAAMVLDAAQSSWEAHQMRERSKKHG